MIWLVVYLYPSEKWWSEFVSWDDEILNIWKHKSHVPNHQPDGDWNVRKIGNLPWFKKQSTNENDGLNNKHGILPAIMES